MEGTIGSTRSFEAEAGGGTGPGSSRGELYRDGSWVLLTIRLMKPTGRVCEEIVYPVDPRWSLKLGVYPLDLISLSNPRLNLSTRSPKLSSLTLISSRSLSPLKVERSRMYVYHSGTWE